MSVFSIRWKNETNRHSLIMVMPTRRMSSRTNKNHRIKQPATQTKNDFSFVCLLLNFAAADTATDWFFNRMFSGGVFVVNNHQDNKRRKRFATRSIGASSLSAFDFYKDYIEMTSKKRCHMWVTRAFFIKKNHRAKKPTANRNTKIIIQSTRLFFFFCKIVTI